MNTPTPKPATTNSTLAQLLAHAGVSVAPALATCDVPISSITDDSRVVTPGACFVAVSGADRDGHEFIESAALAGARAVVVDRDVPIPEGVVCVRVDDSRAALSHLAAAYYGLRPQTTGAKTLDLVGVTGTNGKTTVAWLLRAILRAGGHRAMLIGTIEYDLVDERIPAALTTPGPVTLCQALARSREAGATIGVLEVSSHALAQHRTDGLRFSAGVFTNLSGDHLDYHGTMEDYLTAKRRLFDALGEDAIAVVNRDDPVSHLITANTHCPVISFGLDSKRAAVTAQITAMDVTGSRFMLLGRAFETAIELALAGRHNVSNALAAAATAEALGVNAEAIREGLQAVGGVPGRLQPVHSRNCSFSVLVDYAHTDDALRHALETVRPLTRGALICVFGCGGDRDRTKRPRMAAVADRLADVAYVTSDNPRGEDPRSIVDDILVGFGASPHARVEVEVDRRQAIERAVASARPGDTVLIAGKGHEDYQLVGDDVLAFDDVQVARDCLSRCAVAGAVS